MADLNFNADQAKHAANSLRVIGMAQFAAYGYAELQSDQTNLGILRASALVYIALEFLNLRLLRDKT